MTIWGDRDRVEKIRRLVIDIRHDLATIERILRHMGTKPLGSDLPPRGGL